jgi:hypothetical protein
MPVKFQSPAKPSTRVPSTVWRECASGFRNQPRTRDNTRNIARGRSLRVLEAVTMMLLPGIKSRRGPPGLAEGCERALFALRSGASPASRPFSDGKFRSPLPGSSLFITSVLTRPVWDYSTLFLAQAPELAGSEQPFQHGAPPMTQTIHGQFAQTTLFKINGHSSAAGN